MSATFQPRLVLVTGGAGFIGSNFIRWLLAHEPTVKVLNFVADPPSFQNPGDPITLRWTTSNATDVVITGIGPVPPNGSMTVRPTATTSYSLVAYGKRSQATALVIVAPANTGGGGGGNRPPISNPGPDRKVLSEIITLDGSRSIDPQGLPITFAWRVAGTKLATIDNPDAVRPTVRLLGGLGVYIFELKVTNSNGLFTIAQVRIQKIEP